MITAGKEEGVYGDTVCVDHTHCMYREISDKISVKGYQPQASRSVHDCTLETDLVVQCIENARGTAG